MGWHGNYIAEFQINQSPEPIGGRPAVIEALEARLNADIKGKPLGTTGKHVIKVVKVYFKDEGDH